MHPASLLSPMCDRRECFDYSGIVAHSVPAQRSLIFLQHKGQRRRVVVGVHVVLLDVRRRGMYGALASGDPVGSDS